MISNRVQPDRSRLRSREDDIRQHEQASEEAALRLCRRIHVIESGLDREIVSRRRSRSPAHQWLEARWPKSPTVSAAIRLEAEPWELDRLPNPSNNLSPDLEGRIRMDSGSGEHGIQAAYIQEDSEYFTEKGKTAPSVQLPGIRTIFPECKFAVLLQTSH